MKILVLATTLLLTGATASAQWAIDPASSLPIGDGAGDQILPKIAPTGDGGCYVSWFDGGNGYDVRLQRLDANGVEQWAHNGVLVADRGFSSVQDYALDVHASGDALITFRDDRSGSVQIAVQRVSTTGALVWGALGVQMTNTTAFVTSPKVAGTSSGDVVVAWMEAGTTRVMRLDANGAPAWLATIDMTPALGQYTPADMHGSGDDAILSIVHQTGSSFLSPKHIVAQKFGPAGQLLWGAQPVVVFDGGSLQIGNFPSFVPDGLGGAVFAWYGVSPLQCYAQRILANGAAAFPHNGAVGSTNLVNVRVSPSVAFDAASSSTFLFWKEQLGNQSQSGLYGQRFDAVGNAQWSVTGEELVPISTTQVDWVRTLTTGSGAFVFWASSIGFNQETGRGAVVDANGDFTITPRDFVSTVSGKTRLAAAKSANGEALLAWGDSRNDGGDVLAQNFTSSGGLGATLSSTYCFGTSCPCGNDAVSAGVGCRNSTGDGASLAAEGTASVTADTFVLRATNLRPGQPGLYFQGNNALGGFPFGDGLRCVGNDVRRLVIVAADAGGCSASDGSCGNVMGGTAGPIANHPAQAATLTPGTVKRYQLWYRDPIGSPCGAGFNFTNGVEVVWN